MIKTISLCLALIMLCYIAFVGHYYYQTFSTFTEVQQAQETTSVNPAP